MKHVPDVSVRICDSSRCTAIDNVAATYVPRDHHSFVLRRSMVEKWTDMVVGILSGSKGMVPCSLGANVDSFRRSPATAGMVYLGYANNPIEHCFAREAVSRNRLLTEHCPMKTSCDQGLEVSLSDRANDVWNILWDLAVPVLAPCLQYIIQTTSCFEFCRFRYMCR